MMRKGLRRSMRCDVKGKSKTKDKLNGRTLTGETESLETTGDSVSFISGTGSLR